MSTFFVGEGNIGSAPEFQEFASGNDEPRRLLRLNVYFDNPVPTRGRLRRSRRLLGAG
jgi:single-strand DNA-binding protein